MHRFLRLALKVAASGRHPCHRLGAVLVKGGSVISTASNLSRPFGVDNCGRHAEERALVPGVDFRGAIAYVARAGQRMSRPCPDCMALLASRGVRKVYYYDAAGRACVEKVGVQ